VFLRIRGKLHYLWRAVDQHGTVLDVLVQSRRKAKAATRFFKSIHPVRVALCGRRGMGGSPLRLV
jgi:transposase-like protein